jgi:nitrate reductase NapAB chaperone NapD
MMKTVHLNFVAHSPMRGRWPLALLVFAALAAWLYWHNLQLNRQVEKLHELVADLHHRAEMRRLARQGATEDLTKDLHGVSNRAWATLLNAIESVQTKKVALLVLEPDATNGKLRVTAEAKDVAAMLDYLKRLQQQPGLRDVVLLSQQVNEDDKQQPVRFIVGAQWQT